MPREIFSFGQLPDPYATTRFPVGTLRRRNYIAARIRPDPVDGRKKISMTVRGDSMYPALRPGDVVIVYVDSSLTDVKVGDIVTFIANLKGGRESYYTHRVVQKDFSGIATKGDNNPRRDDFRIGTDNFIGITRKAIEFDNPRFAGENQP